MIAGQAPRSRFADVLPLLVALMSGASPVLLQDIAPGAALDSESYLEVDIGDAPNLLVIATEFWGTELFTVLEGRRQLIADLCPGPCSGNPSAITRIGTRFFFLATDAPGVAEQLWISDGTAAGTLKLADGASHLVLLGAQLVFQRSSGVWVSDGSVAGTKPLAWGAGKTLVSAQATPLHRFVSVSPSQCEVFVTGVDVGEATALPMPAGTAACAEGLVTLGERAFVPLTIGLYRFEPSAAPTLIDAAGSNLARVGAGLFFFRHAAGALSLFHSTGEPGGTTALGTATPSADVRNLGAAEGRLVYSAQANGTMHLYSSDGTVAGTFELPISASTTHAILPVGPVFYVVTETAAGTALIETDGTATGTTVLQGVHPIHAAAQPGHREAKGQAVALALIANVVNAFGAFRIRPGEDPEPLFLKPGNPIGGVFGQPFVSGGTAWFNAGVDTFQTDGTPDASFFLSRFPLLGIAGGKPLVFDGMKMASLDADGGTTAVGEVPLTIAPLGRLSIFTTAGGLFRTDGTVEGTARLATLPSTGFRAGPVDLGDTRAVLAVATRLWFTDGTTNGTKSIEVAGLSGGLVAGKGGAWVSSGNDGVAFVTPTSVTTTVLPRPNPTMLTALGDDLFCVTEGSSLFRVSGSSVTVVGIVPNLRALTVHAGKLFVLGDGKLFERVGNSLELKASAPGSTYLHSAGGVLFTDSASLATGLEPAVFDGTTVVPLGDLSFGPGSSSPSPPVAVGKRFLFFAWTPETGREPFVWEPDAPAPATPRGCGCSTGAELGLLALAFWVRRRRELSVWRFGP